ncbi:TetR/AcrR family transcriptional regulator [Pseudorhodobacter sp. E13]|nr:TetR/AcrR family transcriptional regulator [Pseudorhodobacter sp. E13]
MSDEGRKDRSRSQILDAAYAVFGDLGYDATRVADIAKRAGLTRKTVYNLFTSKEALAEDLIARNEAMAEPLYRARIDGGEDALHLLETILLDSAGWCIANPNIAPLALAPKKRPGLAPPEGRPSFQRIVRDTIALGQMQGFVRNDEDADFMSMLLLGIYAQAMITVLAGHPYDPDQIRRIIRLLVQGIGPRVGRRHLTRK